jgi:hypothetical protein
MLRGDVIVDVGVLPQDGFCVARARDVGAADPARPLSWMPY